MFTNQINHHIYTQNIEYVAYSTPAFLGGGGRALQEGDRGLQKKLEAYWIDPSLAVSKKPIKRE